MSPADLDLLLCLLLWLLAALLFWLATASLGRLVIRRIERSCNCAHHRTRSAPLHHPDQEHSA